MQKLNFAPPDDAVLKKFGISGKPRLLPHGEGRTYRVGNTVLKYINQDSLVSTTWISQLYRLIKPHGCTIASSIPTIDNEWILEGWSAWDNLNGRPSTSADIIDAIPAIQAFHKSLEKTPKPDFLDSENSPYLRADRYAWDEKPIIIHPRLKQSIEKLYQMREPLPQIKNQLIHGDIGPDNILILPNQPPAIIDLAPYFRPADFALAIYAYWIGPYANHPHYLDYFSKIKHFPQLLLRAALRMLLIMSEFNSVHDLKKYENATELVVDYIKQNSTKL